jgi:hypothetical protein
LTSILFLNLNAGLDDFARDEWVGCPA